MVTEIRWSRCAVSLASPLQSAIWRPSSSWKERPRSLIGPNVLKIIGQKQDVLLLLLLFWWWYTCLLQYVQVFMRVIQAVQEENRGCFTIFSHLINDLLKKQEFTFYIIVLSIFTWLYSRHYVNPFATGDAYMRQLFHCIQWYAGSKRVKLDPLSFPTCRWITTMILFLVVYMVEAVSSGKASIWR